MNHNKAAFSERLKTLWYLPGFSFDEKKENLVPTPGYHHKRRFRKTLLLRRQFLGGFVPVLRGELIAGYAPLQALKECKMYADAIFEITLYDVFFAGGLLAALYMLTVFASKKKVPSAVQNFYINLTLAAMAGGYFSGFLFQAVYNFFDYGVFEFKGITFLGGLIGGAAVFLVGYRLFAKEKERAHFSTILDAAPCCILIGHGLGRIGCFFAGCCHGIETDSFLGVYFPVHQAKMYPTQLFEAAFLFIMSGVTSYLFLKDKKINLIVYLISYGIFRFLIEFLRGDDSRGKFLLSFLTPSQTWSAIMVILGAALLYFYFKNKRKQTK